MMKYILILLMLASVSLFGVDANVYGGPQVIIRCDTIVETDSILKTLRFYTSGMGDNISFSYQIETWSDTVFCELYYRHSNDTTKGWSDWTRLDSVGVIDTAYYDVYVGQDTLPLLLWNYIGIKFDACGTEGDSGELWFMINPRKK